MKKEEYEKLGKKVIELKAEIYNLKITIKKKEQKLSEMEKFISEKMRS